MLIPSKHSGYTRDACRCFSFDFGGGGGDPGADARRQEEERQERIRAATNAINAIFDTSILTGAVVGPDGKRYQMGRTSLNADGGGRGGFLKDVKYLARPEDINEYNALYDEQGNKVNIPGFDRGGPFRGATAPSGYSVERVNPRDKLYADQRSAVYDLNKREVDRQATEAERMNRFGLARTGLMGGSVNVDSVADLNRRTNEGLMRAGGIADQASADLKTADERTRSNLISLAQSGIDTGTAAQGALKGLEVNAANAAGARAGSSVGSLFNDMSQAYLMNQQNQGRAAGMQNAQQFPGGLNPRTGGSQGTTY